MKWRVLDSGVNNAFYNMAVDEAVMKASRAGLVPPTIRFYQWSPPGLSLGYFQQTGEEVDSLACRQHKIDVVRRLTGGRAILHDDELTYSIVLNEESGLLPENILDSYKVISTGIIGGLRSLGIDAELKSPRVGQGAPRGFSAACFDAPSWYEVVVKDQKLVGSAQVRRQGVILQHGSIPFTVDADQLFAVLFYPTEEVRDRLKKSFLKKAITINQLTATVTIEELKKALVQSWESCFAVQLVAGQLTPEEKEWTAELVESKYSQESWNLAK